METSKFFTSAIRIMNRLKYPQKFALISAIFIVPIILLIYLLFSDIYDQINFTKKELLGNIYLRPLQEIWVTIPQLQLLNTNWTRNNQIKKEVLSEKIDGNLRFLEKQEKQLNNSLQSAYNFDQIKQIWQTLKKNEKEWSVETIDYYYLIFLNAVENLSYNIGNESNLILEPYADSYYLMDITLFSIPTMQKTLADIKFICAKAIITEQFTPSDRTQLLMLLSLYKNYSLKLIKNIEFAFINNNKGNLRIKLIGDFYNFTKNINQINKLTNELIYTINISKPIIYFRVADKNIQQSIIFGDKVRDELDIILQHRVNNLFFKILNLSLLIIVILLIVMYVFIGFYLGLMQTVEGLNQATQQMMTGEVQSPSNILLNTQDELAEVVNSFNHIANELVKTHEEVNELNLQLKSENLRMSAELYVTHRIQEMILPKESELRKIVDLDIAGFMLPANEVGGDYYDVMQHKGMIKIGMGDVTGHGLESGVLMIMVQTAVRTLLANDETDPVKILTILNKIIYENVQRMESDKNLTLVLLDYRDGLLHISGQHEETIVVRNSGKVERIDTIDLGFPIGLDEHISHLIDSKKIKLDTGDVVVLYTDGITEAENMNKELYGLDRLINILKENYLKQAQEIRKVVISDVQSHIGLQTIYDDITLLVIKKN